MNRNTINPLLIILITIFIDYLGLGIIVPILGPLFFNSTIFFDEAIDNNTRTILLGFLVGTFSLFQFFSGTYLGALSDQKGRKKVLFNSLFVSLVGYLFFATGVQWGIFPLLFIGRGLAGFASGNVSVLYSAIADISKDNEKAKNFGYVGAAFGLGFILGPVTGSILANKDFVSWFNPTTPILFAVLLGMGNLLVVHFYFPETLKETIANKKISILGCFGNIKIAFNTQGRLRWLLGIVFLFYTGFTMLVQFIQVFLIQKFDFNEANIGYLFGYLGVCAVITQGVLLRVLAKWFTPEHILRFSLLLQCVSFALLILPTTKVELYLCFTLFAIGQGLCLPNLSAAISNIVPSDKQGETLGIQQSVQAFVQMLTPLYAGVLVANSIHAPMWVGSIFSLIAWLVFMVKLNNRPHSLINNRN
jgi:DHA1 family tetracycline resistance protein-like MFS transporter